MDRFSVFRTYFDQIGLLVFWFLIVGVINPNGDFPLNDDWCYAKSVKTLMDHNYLKLYNWGEMTLVAHVYFGAIFTKFFGFSFTVLRWSTLLIGGFSVIGIYELCKEIRNSRSLALIIALLCMMNPIFMGLSYTFMTDVPFYCVVIWAVYFFIRSIHTDAWGPLVTAILLCCWAFLIRQIALVLPLAWAGTLIFSRRKNIKSIIKFVLPLLVLIALYFIYTYVMQSQGILQKRYNDKLYLLFDTIEQFDLKNLINVFGYLFISLCYLGFLLAPVQIFFLLKKGFKNIWIWIVLYVVCISGTLIFTGKTIPSLDNVWIDFGIGPVTLFDHYDNFTNTPTPGVSKYLWWLITAIGVFSSASIFVRLFKLFQNNLKNYNIQEPIIFSGLCFLIYLTPFLIVGLYDRYLLPLVPFVLVFLFYGFKEIPVPWFRGVSKVFVLVLGLFSCCAVHDYLSWNRTRWEIISNLKREGINPDHIQGGAEYSTWYYFSEEEEKWWENIKPIYVLVFKTKPQDKVIETYHYDRWLPGDGKIYLVHNTDIE